jgi:hypothetical protein
VGTDDDLHAMLTKLGLKMRGESRDRLLAAFASTPTWFDQLSPDERERAELLFKRCREHAFAAAGISFFPLPKGAKAS